MELTEEFYIHAERYAGLYEKVKRQTGWITVEIGFQHNDVQSSSLFFSDACHYSGVAISADIGSRLLIYHLFYFQRREMEISD